MTSLLARIESCDRMSWTAQPARAFVLGRDLVRDAVQSGAADEAARALQVFAWCCLQEGHALAAVELAAASRRLWHGIGSTAGAAWAGALLAQGMTLVGIADEALAVALAAEDEALAAGAEKTRLFALNARGCVLANSGQIAEAIAVFARMEREAGVFPLMRHMAANNLSDCHRELYANAGRHDASVLTDALHTGLRAVELAREVSYSWGLRCALDNTAQALAELGAWDDAGLLLAEYANVPGTPSLPLDLAHGITVGKIAFHKGDRAGARETLHGVVERALLVRDLEMVIEASQLLVDVLASLGDYEQALQTHRLYHEHYVMMAGQEARWRARVTEIMLEADQLRAETRRLADDARRDPLTGLANRRSLDEVRPRLEAAPYAVVLFDIDHFKAINDRFSHAMGDEVLQTIARLAAGLMEEGDVAVRLGGEEFGLFLAGADSQDGLGVAERLRGAIESFDWDTIAAGLRVTASFGVDAALAGEPSSRTMATADERLYLAKEHGRNRVAGPQEILREQARTA